MTFDEMTGAAGGVGDQYPPQDDNARRYQF
jgi:hypothetical protein